MFQPWLLCSSHDYNCDYKRGRILHVKFLCMFHVLIRYYSIITHSKIFHLFFQNFALCFHNPIFLKILLAKSAHPYSIFLLLYCMLVIIVLCLLYCCTVYNCLLCLLYWALLKTSLLTYAFSH